MIKSIQEVKKYFSKINVSTTYETLGSFLADATDEVIYFVGQELYDEVFVIYENGSANGLQTKLIELIQHAIVNFCMKEYMTFSDSNVGDLGVGRTITEYNQSQNVQVLDKILDKYNKDIDKSINKLLAFLEKNSSSFLSWQDSNYFLESKSLLIGSSTEFGRIYSIENNAIAFLLLLPHIKNVEIQEIENNFSEDFLILLKQKQANNTLSGKEAKAVDLMKRCITFFTMQYALPQKLFEVRADGIKASVVTTTNAQKSNPAEVYVSKIIEQATKDAGFYFKTLKTYLDDNVNDFPIYRDSGKYTPPTENPTHDYCTDEDNKVFFM
jgi:hypothetical protein